MELTIRSEEALWELVEKAVKDQLGEFTNIVFDGWPTLEIRLTGPRFEQTLTPSVMEGIIDLQTRLNRAYAYLVYGEHDAKRLLKHEREAIEFTVKVEQGSSELKFDLTEVLKTFVERSIGKMNGKEIFAAVAVVAGFAASDVAWNSWLDHEQALRKMEHDVRMEEVQNERMRLLTDVINGDRRLLAIQKDLEDGRAELFRHLKRASTVEIAGNTLTQEEVVQIASKPRETAEDIRLDGSFRVYEVNVRDLDKTKLHLVRRSDNMEFTATYSQGHLGFDQTALLTQAIHERRWIKLVIFGKQLRDKITTAEISFVGEFDSPPANAAD